MARTNQNAGSGLPTALLRSAKRNGIPMASKSTLNAKNLEALGTERLAQLLIEISTGDAAASASCGWLSPERKAQGKRRGRSPSD